MASSSDQPGKRMEHCLDAWLTDDSTIEPTPPASVTSMAARHGPDSEPEDKDAEASKTEPEGKDAEVPKTEPEDEGAEVSQAEPEDRDAAVSKQMRRAVKTILKCIGEDPNREGLRAASSRFVESLVFITKGYKDNLNAIAKNAIRPADHDGMVVVKDIEIYSLCEHHLLPFSGKVHIGYLPNGRVIAITKLARIANMFARRLQSQERLTSQIANAIMEVLQPTGVAVVIESSHLCMTMCSVRKTGSSAITECMLGGFGESCLDGPEKVAMRRAQFWNLVGLHNRR